jgi:cell division septal protein FtsQ
MNREDKEERVQRIRIGLTGLAFVFLLVLLGTAISRSGDEAPASSVNDVAVEPNEPLAEIGAAPGGAPSSANESVDQGNQTKAQ